MEVTLSTSKALPLYIPTACGEALPNILIAAYWRPGAACRWRCCCRLLGADIYSFDFKISHIAQHVQLPKPPRLGPGAAELPPGERLPPILVINLQLPMYSVRGPKGGRRGCCGCVKRAWGRGEEMYVHAAGALVWLILAWARWGTKRTARCPGLELQRPFCALGGLGGRGSAAYLQ